MNSYQLPQTVKLYTNVCQSKALMIESSVIFQEYPALMGSLMERIQMAPSLSKLRIVRSIDKEST